MARSEFPAQENRPLGQPSDLPPVQQEPYRSSEGRDQHGWRQNGSQRPSREVAQARRTVRALGWFSIGLGLSEVAMAGTVARLAGIQNSRGVLRMLGAREIAHGLGILSGRRPAAWVWSRVLGDVTVLAVLG